MSAATQMVTPAARLGSHVLAMTAGVVVGVACVIPALFLTESQARLLMALALACIGFIYVGFAVADGRPSAIAAQAVAAVAFLWTAYAGVQLGSTTLLGVGFLAHAAWDAVHHEGHGPTRVRTWYPPFCVVTDVAIAVPLLAGWI